MINTKRAILLALLLYIILFAVGIASGLFFGMDFEAATEAPDMVWVVGFFASIILVYVCTKWYFKQGSVKANLVSGFLFGGVCIAVGAVVDIVLILPWIAMADSSADPLLYYSNPWFWSTLLAIVATSSIVGVQLSSGRSTVHHGHIASQEE